MDKVNFQGKTTLVTSPQMYAERLRNISDKSSLFTNFSHIKHGVSRICKLNDGDLFIMIHNGSEGSLRRIEYDRQLGAQNIIENICEDLQNFGKNVKENITCMILGGRSRDSLTTTCVNNIANSVEDNLSAHNMKGDISIISGLTDELKSPIFIDYSRTVKNPEIYIPTDIEGKVSADKLEDLYDIVELNNTEIIN